MITRIGTRAQSKLPTQFGVELSGINFGCRASTREPDFADQSLGGIDGQNPSRGQMCCHLGKHRRLQRSSPVVLASGMTFDEVLDDYPALEREDVLAALEFAAVSAGDQQAVLFGP